MIRIRSVVDSSMGDIITPTIFPDGTSQVWKLDEKYRYNTVELTWEWEGNESELIWINQLICLLYQMGTTIEELYIPYLPYARQDKEVGNEATFARHVFLELLLKEHVRKVTTLDIHSSSDSVQSYTPFRYISQSITESDADVIVYPDAGSYNRYNDWIQSTYGLTTIVLDKVRNQLTGKIEGLDVNKDLTDYISSDDNQCKMLIIDDLSDYGGTFKKASTFLKDRFSGCDVSLYVTHFLGHGDIASYREAGIASIYTSPSLYEYRKKFQCDDEGVIIMKGNVIR